MKLGILGAGWIAQKMAEALKDKPHGCECHAIGSRSLDKAQISYAPSPTHEELNRVR